MPSSRSRIKDLYDQYADPLYRFMYWHTSDPLLAEDLTSEVFVRAWKHHAELQDDRARAWLYRVARNLVADHYRRKHDATLDDNYDPVSDYDIQAEAEVHERQALIHVALHQLSPVHRTIVVLRFFEHMPIREVARIIDKSEANTRVLQHRALKELKKRLKL